MQMSVVLDEALAADAAKILIDGGAENLQFATAQTLKPDPAKQHRSYYIDLSHLAQLTFDVMPVVEGGAHLLTIAAMIMHIKALRTHSGEQPKLRVLADGKEVGIEAANADQLADNIVAALDKSSSPPSAKA